MRYRWVVSKGRPALQFMAVTPEEPNQQIEYLHSTTGALIADASRRLVVDLFLRQGRFWTLVHNLRVERSIAPVVGIAPDVLGTVSWPENKPEHSFEAVSRSGVLNMHLSKERRQEIEEHNRYVVDYEQAWLGDLDRIVKQVIPKELKRSTGGGASLTGLGSGGGRLSNEYGFWMRFVSMCVLYDPPDTELVEFAACEEPRPYRVSVGTDGDGKTISMESPPVRALAEPAEERALFMSQVNLILDEINERHLQPLGLDVHELWDDVLRNNPTIITEVGHEEALLQRRLYIEIDESTTDQDVRAAYRLIRAKQKRDRWSVPVVADADTRRAILDAKKGLPARVKGKRDPLLALQCTVLYDRHNQTDAADRRSRKWTYKRLAERFELKSARAAKEYVLAGRRMLEKN